MKILHVITSLARSTGGPPIVVIGLARALSMCGVSARIITTDALTPVQASVPRAGAGLEDFPAGAKGMDIVIARQRRPYRLLMSPGLGWAVWRALPRTDVVHIHSLNLFPQFITWLLCTIHGRPYVVSPHGALDPWVRARAGLRIRVIDLLWQRRMLDHAAAIHVTTPEEASAVRGLGYRAPIVTIAPGFEGSGSGTARRMSEVTGRTARRRWLQGYAGTVILNHGRISEKKGLDRLVAAEAILVARGHDVRLVLVGPDDEGVGEALIRLATRTGLGDRLVLLSPMVPDDLHIALGMADVWVLPSHGENFGVAVVEAMAAGRPVVVTPAVSIAAEAASHEAIVLTTGEPDDLADRLDDLVADPDRCALLGEQARAFTDRYAWETLVPHYVALYERAMTTRPARRYRVRSNT